MENLMELFANEDEQEQAPCKFGNIVVGHACYCHHESPDAPRKCYIWRDGDDWNKENCSLFERYNNES